MLYKTISLGKNKSVLRTAFIIAQNGSENVVDTRIFSLGYSG